MEAGRGRVWRALGKLFVALLIFAGAAGGYLYYRFIVVDRTPHYEADLDHFKYGSTGGDRLAGIPVGIWQLMPRLCREYLPGGGWESLGFLYETVDGKKRDLPIGLSSRRSLGFDRVFFNCATCHYGSYRTEPDGQQHLVAGMPANGLDLAGFRKFVAQCIRDSDKFNAIRVVDELKRSYPAYGLIDRTALALAGVTAIKELILLLDHRFSFLDRETATGPGRFDTFGPAKVLFNWPLDQLEPRETVGVVDLPSIWNQKQREERGMQLHWDGNNVSVAERNRSAAFGTGALPGFADRESLARTYAILQSESMAPPSFTAAFPNAFDAGKAARGAPVYAAYCAACHGRSGSDFTGDLVGKVTDIAMIGTDPCRLDNYTRDLAANQNLLYGGFPSERFSHFRKTGGYANPPLDGLWLRGPYLHNGSVPTVRALLEPAGRRPTVFWRGDDVIDPVALGFVSDRAEANGRTLFRYEVDRRPDADHVCHPGPQAGNGNRGHEGEAYGTLLADADKDALVEYLKTF